MSLITLYLSKRYCRFDWTINTVMYCKPMFVKKYAYVFVCECLLSFNSVSTMLGNTADVRTVLPKTKYIPLWMCIEKEKYLLKPLLWIRNDLVRLRLFRIRIQHQLFRIRIQPQLFRIRIQPQLFQHVWIFLNTLQSINWYHF